jgi:hypothetical protein
MIVVRMIKAAYLISKADPRTVFKCADKFAKQVSKIEKCDYRITNEEYGIILKIFVHQRKLLGELERRLEHIKGAKIRFVGAESDPNEPSS